jgi:hypothetical protein
MLHHMLRAAAQRAFQTLDPYFKYVTMLLHGDGSMLGSTTVTPFNADASTNNFNIAINGDARSNNFNPYQSGYYSNYFDGTGDYLTVPDNAAFDMGSSDFTIEGWVFLSSTGASQTFIAKGTGAGNQASYHIVFNGTNWLYYLSGNGSTWSIASGVTMGAGTANTWQHLALVRSGSTFTPYVNGTAGTTTTSATALFDSNNVFSIGADDATNQRLTGFISNCRAVKGTAVYTSNFTPSTTPLTAITNTSLLTCQSNRFIDNSTNAFTITKAGDTAVSPAQPFTLPTTVATYGSGYFDGTGDYLTLPVNAAFDLGTNACCVESWVYLTSTSAIYMFATSSNVNGQTRPNFYARYDQIQLDYFGNVIIQANVSVPQNSWNHVVFTRASSSGAWRIFLNGVLQAYNATGSQNLLQTGAAQLINSLNGSTTASGYITDLRVVNGAVPSAYVTSSTTTGTQIFTPPTAPLTAITSTSLLTTQYNGGGNNNGFKDSSQNNFVITRNGNTTQGTFTPYGSNWSNYFTGSSGLTGPTSTSLGFGSSDFTVEFWANIPSTSGFGFFASVWEDSGGSDANSSWLIRLNNNGTLLTHLMQGTSNTNNLVSGQLSTNTWFHCAYTRSGGTIYLFINGVLAQSASVSGAMNTAVRTIKVGYQGTASNYLTGYVSNLRVINGTCLYTTTFTPSTTPLTAVTNTQFLSCQSNRFIDNSTNAATITTTGSPSVQRFSPFSPTSAYSTSVIGGSGYFDGSVDSISAPDSAAFNMTGTSYCFETWIYPTTSAEMSIFSRCSGTGLPGLSIQKLSNGQILFSTNDDYSTSSGTTVLANTWSHIACTYDGSTKRVFLNGALMGSTSSSWSEVATAMTIGDRPSDSRHFYMVGYVSNSRIVKGSAVYTSAFTPPTAPLSAISGTSLLLNYTNAGILDNAMMNDLETVGNAQISTSVKKYGTGSLAFDGTGDYLFGSANQNVALGTGDFTVEAWLYVTTFSTTTGFQAIFSNRNSTSAQASFDFGIRNSDKYLYFYNRNTDSSTFSTSGLSGINTWIHVAIVRVGTTVTFYINGTSAGTVSVSTNSFGSSNVAYIGTNFNATPDIYNGNIDDLRITKGVARYTANFTAPTAAFPNN